MERIEKAIRDYMAMQQEHYEWKRKRAEKLDAQDAELIRQNQEVLDSIQELKDICEKQAVQIDMYQETINQINKRLDIYGIGFNCGGYHD